MSPVGDVRFLGPADGIESPSEYISPNTLLDKILFTGVLFPPDQKIVRVLERCGVYVIDAQ
jgi:hypothetical protein